MLNKSKMSLSHNLFLLFSNDASKTSNGILSFYAGKVSKILSKNLGIILLEDGELIVFLMDYRGSYCGLREGAIIALKNFHLCVVNILYF